MDERQTLSAVLNRIRRTYSAMTPAYRSLAKYVLDHHKELAFAPVSRVAALAGSSPATVVRFSEHLGLSGYSQLQSLARDAIRQEVNTVSQLKRASAQQKRETLLGTALRADIANLERALASVSEDNFSKTVNILSGARIVHLVGLRSTFGLVQHFASYLGWIGRQAEILQPGIGELPEQVMRIGVGDACVAFSFRRYTRDTVEIFKMAHGQGAKTIALTDSELSPLTEFADVSLVVPVAFPAFFESRTAVLSIVNALVLAVALDRQRDTIEALREHERAWSQYATYTHENLKSLNADIEAFAARMPASRRVSTRSRRRRNSSS